MQVAHDSRRGGVFLSPHFAAAALGSFLPNGVSKHAGICAYAACI